MSLLQSVHLSESSAPRYASKLPSEAYVLSLAVLPAHYAALSSAPTNKIHLLDRATLQNASALDGHPGGTTSLRAVDGIGGTNQHVLVSSGKDGVVKIWDGRTNAPGLQLIQARESRALLCADVSPDGNTVVAGTELAGDDALLLYWDPRNPAAPLRVHASTHSDDVTAVHFQRAGDDAGRRVLSASSDGLVSISNANEEDEDEAVVHVGNWGCSISQTGWMARQGAPPRVWAASDMETFSTWSDELDPLNDLDIRAPSIHTQERTWVTDYLIGCHSSDEGGLSVFVGSNEGDVALLSNGNYFDRASPWSLQRLFTGAHAGVVRSVLWDDRHNVLITGGEDAKLHAWSCPPLPHVDGSMDVDEDIEMGDF
ncbi:WD40 repeat-like protein [Amylostereum chailletii]|nr:WD40 repeat-like protein [Amylostereum chailletii]